MKKPIKIITVMPAYNAEKTLEKTFKDISDKYKRHLFLVDDGSRDKTVKIANKLGIKTIVHKHNRGYGANQKTCYKKALSDGADIVVMLHPDFQYDPRLIDNLINPIINGHFDIMLGSRIRSIKESIQGGMPIYKYFANKFITTIENILLHQNLSEYHTGFRAFHKRVLKQISFHKFSDDFVFDQQILIEAIKLGYKIGEIPVPIRYFPDSSSIGFLKSIKYGLNTLSYLIR